MDAHVGVGKSSADSAWVNEQTSIIGKEEVNIRTEKNTHIEGAIIAAENGNLKLDTDTLTYKDIYDHDKSENYQANLSGSKSAENAKNSETRTDGEESNPYAGTLDGSYSSHDRQQINRATIGEGEIIIRSDPDAGLEGLNRDLEKAQEITKDEKTSVTVYVDSAAIKEIASGGAGIEANLEKLEERIEQAAEYLKEKFPNSATQIEAQMTLRDHLLKQNKTEDEIRQIQRENAAKLAFSESVAGLVDEYGSLDAIPNEELVVLVDAMKAKYADASTVIPISFNGEVAALLYPIKKDFEMLIGMLSSFSDDLAGGIEFVQTTVNGSLYQVTGAEIYKKDYDAYVATSNAIQDGIRFIYDNPEQFKANVIANLKQTQAEIRILRAEGKHTEANILEGKIAYHVISVAVPTGTGAVKATSASAKMLKKVPELVQVAQKYTKTRWLSSKLRTKADGALFWSGKTEGVRASTVSESYAQKYNSTTLESLLDKNGIEMPEWDIHNSKSVEAWEAASRDFASKASGTVRVVLGKESRPGGGVWDNVEYPALKANPKVTDIIAVDPKTGVERVLYINSSHL